MFRERKRWRKSRAGRGWGGEEDWITMEKKGGGLRPRKRIEGEMTMHFKEALSRLEQ